MKCKNCGEPIGYRTDDPAYREIGGLVHRPEDGPDAYLYCKNDDCTEAETDVSS